MRPQRATGLSPRVRECLADGEWHTFGEIYRKVANQIDPSQATRHELTRIRARQRWHGGEVPRDLPAGTPLDVHIRRGRSRILWYTFNRLGCEHEGAGIQARWRKPPSQPCAVCGGDAWPFRGVTPTCSDSCRGKLGQRTQMGATA
jgi:hypothetical protein